MSSDDDAILVQSVLDNAKRLGLLWQLQPATVTFTSANPMSVIITLDGDTTPIGACSLIGNLTEDDRVMVLITPPSGNFIIGTYGT